MDNDTLLGMLKGLVEEGRDVSLIISGSSMAPFLVHHRDEIFFGQPGRPLRRGDMVFYQRPNGQYVMHRICRVKPDGYYIVGDAQTEIEGPVARGQIFALVKKVKRKGKWLGPDDFWWKFFERAWIRMIPLRPFVVKAYALFSGTRPTDKTGNEQ